MSFLGRFFSRGGSHHIGIDFGSAEIKAVQFSGSAHGPTLEHVYRMPTPVNAIKDGIVADPPAVGDALRQLVADGAFTARRVVTSVTGPTVVVRQVTMPVMSERELTESTKYEAERFLPYSVEEAQMDAKILGRSEDGQNMDVLIVAAQKELVLSQLAALQAAGLQAAVVEIEPFAMVRAMLAPDDPVFEQ